MMKSARLEVLRVHAAYARAEAQALDSSLQTAHSYARRGYGGGTAMTRIAQRRRRLVHRLEEIEQEKDKVKRDLEAASKSR